MKSGDRCKETYKGDRCTKSRGHSSELAVTRDAQHVGGFNAWEGDRGSQKLLATSSNRAKLRRRNVNKILRHDPNMLAARLGRPAVIAMMKTIEAGEKRR